MAPTAEPTPELTAEPTMAPTAEPTPELTAEPTMAPTAEPTAEPTMEPPSMAPSAVPSTLTEVAPPEQGCVVSGVILTPEGSILPSTADVIVEVQDTSLLDVAAVPLGQTIVMITDPTTSEIAFEVECDASMIEENATITLSVRIEAADGKLLYINDTATPVIADGAPSTDVVVNVIDAQAQASGTEPMADEMEAAESPAA
jgi:uncharacterized lipoprotein YbaY